ncbi:MAG: hypothetical protein ACERKV_04465 [Clostridiaceae bacterium]
MDNFHEQLIRVEKESNYKVVNVLFYFFTFFALFFLFSFNLILLAFSGIFALTCFFLKKKLFVEYEYVFTNGEIDIDSITEKKKRKKVLNISIKSIELLDLEGSNAINDFYNKPTKVLSALSSGYNKKVYVAMVTGGEERVQLRFAPDEEFLDLCYKYNPRAVKKIY